MPSARYAASATLAKRPEGELKAFKMRYSYGEMPILAAMVQSLKHFTIAFLTQNSKKCFPIPTPVQRLTHALRQLGILSQAEDSVKMRLFALFRADPCLRLLEGLEQDLRQKRQQMTVRCFALKIEKIEK